jgi:glutamate--cysteine ligase
MTAVPPETPVESTADLLAPFRAAAKPRGRFLVGVEHEKLAVRDGGDPVAYEGERGIGALLETLGRRGWTEKREGGRTIAVARGDEHVTLEPGGQVELSGAALPTAAACAAGLARHVAELDAAARPLGIRFIAGGFRPFGTIDDVPWFLKRRYEIMRAYLPRVGRLAHEMMKRTATVQVNLDFSDEQDAADKVRVALATTSIVTALFAASPVSEGRPNGYKSYRAAVWLETDEARCGILPFVFERGFDLERYVTWALDVPMFFVVRGDRHHEAGGRTFRDLLREGFEGTAATYADWVLHLSTLFPEVRIKRTIELRGADAAPGPYASALAALWRGALDDPAARAEAWRLTADLTVDERERLRREVPRAGLAARARGRTLAELARALVEIADDGLRRLPGGAGDRPLLAPLRESAAAGRSPADDMLADYERLGGDPARLVDAWEHRA